MKRCLLFLALLISVGQITKAEVLYSGGGVQESTPLASGSKAIASTAPRRHAADLQLASLCQSLAMYCLVADSTNNRLHLFQNSEGVMAWDIIMLPPAEVMRGFITQIDLNPSWCPTDSVRRKFPGLPAGCLPPGHPQNAMGEVKILMDGDFVGTAIRIHDTRGFGADWPNEDSSGCVRVLDLKTEVLPLIGYGKKGQVEVVFR